MSGWRSLRAALGGAEMQKVSEFERRMGEIRLRLDEAEREAQSARTAAGAAEPEPPRVRVGEPEPPPPPASAGEPQVRARVADPGPGRWLDDFEGGTNMSEAAAAYEVQVTGKAAAGTGDDVGGVQFDGYKGGVLIDAKHYLPGQRMDRLLRERNIFVGISLVEQAERQLLAAGRMPVESFVASEESAQVIRSGSSPATTSPSASRTPRPPGPRPRPRRPPASASRPVWPRRRRRRLRAARGSAWTSSRRPRPSRPRASKSSGGSGCASRRPDQPGLSWSDAARHR